MNITEEEIRRCPPITAVLQKAEGGLAAVVDALRFSREPVVQQFLDTYDELEETQRIWVPWEAIAIEADIDIPQFVYAVILAIGNASANLVKIMAVSNHPRVMDASIRNALRPSGVQDRKMIHTMLRALPQPKGAVTIIQTSAGEQVITQGIDPEDVETNEMFPPLEETQKLLEE